jgi:hypothetical protein
MERKESQFRIVVLENMLYIYSSCFSSIDFKCPIQIWWICTKKVKSCKNISSVKKFDMEKQFFLSFYADSMLICHHFFFFDWFYDILSFILLSLLPSLMWLYRSEILSSIEVLCRRRQDRKTDFLHILLSLLLIIWYRETEEPSSSSPWLPPFFIEIFCY